VTLTGRFWVIPKGKRVVPAIKIRDAVPFKSASNAFRKSVLRVRDAILSKIGPKIRNFVWASGCYKRWQISSES